MKPSVSHDCCFRTTKSKQFRLFACRHAPKPRLHVAAGNGRRLVRTTGGFRAQTERLKLGGAQKTRGPHLFGLVVDGDGDEDKNEDDVEDTDDNRSRRK